MEILKHYYYTQLETIGKKIRHLHMKMDASNATLHDLKIMNTYVDLEIHIMHQTIAVTSITYLVQKWNGTLFLAKI